jgi:predicted nucleic acid-binding protein
MESHTHPIDEGYVHTQLASRVNTIKFLARYSSLQKSAFYSPEQIFNDLIESVDKVMKTKLNKADKRKFSNLKSLLENIKLANLQNQIAEVLP